MTAEEAFSYCVNRYPSLYASLNERSTRMAVYDQFFNVIGNGYRDLDDMEHHFTWTPAHHSVTSGVPAKYMGPEPIFEGYMKAVTTRGQVEPDFESRMRGFYTEAEKALYPDVQYWEPREKGEGIGFYPTFKEEFSLLHRIERDALDVSWLQAGIYFYTQAKEYFAGPDSDDYSRAWPSDPARQRQKIKEFERDTRVSDPAKKAELWATLSTNYGVPYTGDTPAFLQTCWTKEKSRIEKFIDSTLSMLQADLDRRVESGMAP